MVMTDFEQMHGESHLHGESYSVSLWYPRQRSIKNIVIDLMDVRAADEIRVSYDFTRDGWVIEQPSQYSWEADDEVCDRGWIESAFLPAWAYEKDDEV